VDRAPSSNVVGRRIPMTSWRTKENLVTMISMMRFQVLTTVNPPDEPLGGGP